MLRCLGGGRDGGKGSKFSSWVIEVIGRERRGGQVKFEGFQCLYNTRSFVKIKCQYSNACRFDAKWSCLQIETINKLYTQLIKDLAEEKRMQ